MSIFFMSLTSFHHNLYFTSAQDFQMTFKVQKFYNGIFKGNLYSIADIRKKSSLEIRQQDKGIIF